ncbi:hypothetical protein SAVIM338S_06940 [Streptomyces avidinii]
MLAADVLHPAAAAAATQSVHAGRTAVSDGYGAADRCEDGPERESREPRLRGENDRGDCPSGPKGATGPAGPTGKRQAVTQGPFTLQPGEFGGLPVPCP